MINTTIKVKDLRLGADTISIISSELSSNPLMQKEDCYYENVNISNGQTISANCICYLNTSSSADITLYFPSDISSKYQYDSIVLMQISDDNSIPSAYQVVLPQDIVTEGYDIKAINITSPIIPSLSGNYVYTYTYKKDDVNKEYVVITGGKHAIEG